MTAAITNIHTFQSRPFKIKLMLMLFMCIMLLNGCNSSMIQLNKNAYSYQVCDLPASKKLPEAIIQSHTTLRKSFCQSNFNHHFKTLIQIASGAPMDSNLEALAEFSRWGVQEGIISQKQSEESLRRYFTPQLVSLEYNSDFNTYSHCSMSRQLAEIQTMLTHELEQKRQGLAGALGDTQSYRQAVKEYKALNLFLENTSSACQFVKL